MDSRQSIIFGENADFRYGVVALIGPANAGKSTLLNTLVGSKISIVSSKQQTTRNRILGIRNRRDAQIVYLDTPGFMARRYRGALSKFVHRVLADTSAETDLSVLVIDGRQMLEDQGCVVRLRSSFENQRIGRLAVVAVNKVDSIDKRKLLPLLAELQEEFIARVRDRSGREPELIPVSALKGDGVDILEDVLVRRLPAGPACFSQDIITDQPEEFYVAEVIREKLTRKLGAELPYSLAVTVEKWQEHGDIIHIGAAILVERTSQKGIVIGQGGKILKAVGQAARRELEKIFQSRINLQLFVKVEPDWTRSQSGLRKAGYRSGRPY